MESVAAPFVTVAAPRSVAPSLKSTEPPGAAPPIRVATNCTVAPAVAGLGVAASKTVGAGWATLIVAVAVAEMSKPPFAVPPLFWTA